MIHSLVRYAPGRAFLMCCLLFFSAGAAHPREADLGPALQVDVGSASHPISPFIYGINFAGEALASELRLPVRRWGGNATTRYNWKINVANRGSDWFFENLAEASDNPARLPRGRDGHDWIQLSGHSRCAAICHRHGRPRARTDDPQKGLVFCARRVLEGGSSGS